MLIALTGSHGVGKTTLFTSLKERYSAQYLSSATRHQSDRFGYGDPVAFAKSIGSAAFQMMNMNMWTVIDPAVNTLLDSRLPIITDRCSVDNYAYYLALRTERDAPLHCLVTEMAKHYASFIDTFVYFPTGKFPCVGGDKRLADPLFQQQVDDAWHEAFEALGCEKSKLYTL